MAIDEQPGQSLELLTISEKANVIFPHNANVKFPRPSYFRIPDAPISLPFPAELRQIATQSTNPEATTDRNRPPPVTSPKVGLLVKYGRAVTVSEGQTLLFVRNTLSSVVPVPEVYDGVRVTGRMANAARTTTTSSCMADAAHPTRFAVTLVQV
jgi:hypothetical protein